MNEESWLNFSKIIPFYKAFGFEYKDVAWTVPVGISNITKPIGNEDFYMGSRVLVGSAEQSFLNVYESLDLKKLYYGVTPCFRDEQYWDDLHRPYFIKLELFSRDTSRLQDLIDSARIGFKSLTSKPIKVVEVQDESYDIEINGIEVGSYMTRSYGGMKWVCGTGLAEPRFTTAINYDTNN